MPINSFPVTLAWKRMFCNHAFMLAIFHLANADTMKWTIVYNVFDVYLVKYTKYGYQTKYKYKYLKILTSKYKYKYKYWKLGVFKYKYKYKYIFDPIPGQNNRDKQSFYWFQSIVWYFLKRIKFYYSNLIAVPIIKSFQKDVYY